MPRIMQSGVDKLVDELGKQFPAIHIVCRWYSGKATLSLHGTGSAQGLRVVRTLTRQGAWTYLHALEDVLGLCYPEQLVDAEERPCLRCGAPLAGGMCGECMGKPAEEPYIPEQDEEDRDWSDQYEQTEAAFYIRIGAGYPDPRHYFIGPFERSGDAEQALSEVLHNPDNRLAISTQFRPIKDPVFCYGVYSHDDAREAGMRDRALGDETDNVLGQLVPLNRTELEQMVKNLEADQAEQGKVQ